MTGSINSATAAAQLRAREGGSPQLRRRSAAEAAGAGASAAAATFTAAAQTMIDCRGHSFDDFMELCDPKIPQLKTFFNFQGNKALNNYAFVRILKQHPNCTYNVKGTSVTQGFLERLSQYYALQTFGTAREIDILVVQSQTWIPTLDISHKTDAKIDQFITALKEHSNSANKITRLSLKGHKTVKVEQIRLMIQHMPKLQHINLTDTGLTQAEIRQSIILGDIELHCSPVFQINSIGIAAATDAAAGAAAAPVVMMQAFYIDAQTTAEDIGVLISRMPDAPFTVNCVKNQIITVDHVKAILAKPKLVAMLLNAANFTATDFVGLDPELATKIKYRQLS